MRTLDNGVVLPGRSGIESRACRGSGDGSELVQGGVARRLGSWGIAVMCVAVMEPKRGTVVDTAQSRAGSIETKWTASVPPALRLPRRTFRFWGLRKGNGTPPPPGHSHSVPSQ